MSERNWHHLGLADAAVLQTRHLLLAAKWLCFESRPTMRLVADRLLHVLSGSPAA